MGRPPLSFVFQRDSINETVKDSTPLIEEKVIETENEETILTIENSESKILKDEKLHISRHMTINSLITGEKNFGDASSITIKDEETSAGFNGNQFSNSNSGGKLF